MAVLSVITYFKKKVKFSTQYQEHNVIALLPTLNMEQQFQSTLTPKSTDLCDLIIMQSSLSFLSGLVIICSWEETCRQKETV